MHFLTPASLATLGRLLLAAILLLVEHSALHLEGSDRRKHLCFRWCFLLLTLAELLLFFGTALSTAANGPIELYAWLIYYPLWVCALMMAHLGFSSPTEGDRPDEFDRQLRFRGGACAAVMALGVLGALTFHTSIPSPTFWDLGWRNAVWLLAQLGVLAALFLRMLNRPQMFTSGTVLKLFLFGCVLLTGGCAARYVYAAKEPLTTVAFALFAAAALRELLHEREAQRLQQLEEKDQELRLLHHIATRLKSTFQLEELFNILLQNLVGDLQAVAGGVFVRHGDGLIATALQGAFPPPVPVPDYAVTRQRFLHEFLTRTPVPADAGVMGQVVATGQPVMIRDAKGNGLVRQTVPDLIQIESVMAFPLLIEDAVYGVIQLVNRRDGAPFSEQDQDFMQLVVEQAALAIHNARLHQEMIEKQRTEHELSLARDIQLRLIPHTLPQVEGINVGAVYKAARQIGGDYYDFYPIDDTHLGIAIADVAGKGVPGALVMIMARTILKMLAANHLSTAHIISEINEAIAPELRQGMFVTACYAILDIEQQTVRLSSAGHNPMLVWRAGTGECQSFKPQGMALGFATGPKFYRVLEEQNITLDKGDRIILYTDGVTEAMDPNMEEFGEKRFQQIISEAGGCPSQELLDKIVVAIEAHAGPKPQYDDITMVAIQVE